VEQYAPKTAEEITDLITAAIANGEPLEVGGNLTMQALGNSVEAAHLLSTRNMRGVHFYEPSELVVSLRPGTTMGELKELLESNNQELAFEPFDYGHLYGREPLSGTVAGMVSVNATGPRRIKSGAARDHLLGFTAISGRGELFQSGGRVMKNVTGYDLSKLMTGSYGTLAVLTDLTLKVLPKPEMEETLVITGLGEQQAIDIMTEASGLPHEASSFTHLPTDVSNTLDEPFKLAVSQTALRLEGPEVSVTKRKQDLQDHFKSNDGEFHTISSEHSRTFWNAIRDCKPLAARKADIWRVSTAPTSGARLMAAIRKTGIDPTVYYDWAGGLIYLATETSAEQSQSAIRTALATHGGHATLIRRRKSSNQDVSVFHPQPPPLAALTGRIKDSFDPKHILNRRRMRKDL